MKLVAALPGIQESCALIRELHSHHNTSANEAAPLIALEGKP